MSSWEISCIRDSVGYCILLETGRSAYWMIAYPSIRENGGSQLDLFGASVHVYIVVALIIPYSMSLNGLPLYNLAPCHVHAPHSHSPPSLTPHLPISTPEVQKDGILYYLIESTRILAGAKRHFFVALELFFHCLVFLNRGSRNTFPSSSRRLFFFSVVSTVISLFAILRLWDISISIKRASSTAHSTRSLW